MITIEDTHGVEGREVVVRYTEDYEKEQLLVLLEALAIYADRNVTRKDNWRKQGWRGPLYDLRDKVERAWDLLWDYDTPGPEPDLDDVLDSINYAAILVRAVRSGDRDGTWFASEPF